MNADAIAFIALVTDAAALVAGITALIMARIEDKEARMALLASLPVIGKTLAAIIKTSRKRS